MDLVTVDSVELRDLSHDHLHGGRLETPVAGTSSGSYTVQIEGWLIGKTGRAQSVEVLHDGQPILRLPVTEERPDVASAFAEVSEAQTSGFRGSLGVLRLPKDFELLVRGILANGTEIPIGTVRGHRQKLQPASPSTPRPLIVTTLGRTGSTWCIWLLQSHPAIVGYRPFQSDARVGSYWMSVLQTLSDPGNYLRQLEAGDATGAEWWMREKTMPMPKLGDLELAHWLGTERVDEVAAMCRDMVTSFYEHVAAAEGKQAAFFVEKHLPRQSSTDLLLELYPDAAEVVLVRDLRDMFCSILAFNEKRGYTAFGRESASSDEQYIETVRRSGQSLLRHLSSEGRNAYLMRYEDLVLQPTKTLEPLLDFIGLDGSLAPDVVDRASVAATGMDHHMTAPSATASIGRWRRDLEPQLIERCDELLAPLLAEFGYSPEGYEIATSET
jgi:hypothetical protein